MNTEVVRCTKCGQAGWAGPKYVRYEDVPRGVEGWPQPINLHADALAVQCVTCGFQRFFPTVENGGEPMDPLTLQGAPKGKGSKSKSAAAEPPVPAPPRATEEEAEAWGAVNLPPPVPPGR